MMFRHIKKFVKLFFLFVLGMISVTMGNEKALATADQGNGSSATGFNYQVMLPENQIDSSLGYYDLAMNPSQQQVISMTLTNPGEEAIKVGLKLNAAKTNNNGVIEYNRPDIENDPSLQFNFNQLVSVPETIDLAAGETKQLDISIQMPETAYDGVIAGGLTMQRIVDETEGSDSEAGSYVNNKYAYAVSILLREGNNDLQPDLQFNKAYAGQQNYRNTIFVSFSNVVATYVNNLTVDAQITAEGSNEVLWETRRTTMRMAPNSFIDFPISMAGSQMEPGQYTAHVNAYIGDQKWEWHENFEISEKEANEYNERDAGLVQERGIDWRLIATIVIGFIALVGIIFFIVTRRKNKKKKLAKKSKKKS
ncbi:DUF916 and DUF3324 domain-containing protein [Enterococcus sp. LJL90]